MIIEDDTEYARFFHEKQSLGIDLCLMLFECEKILKKMMSAK